MMNSISFYSNPALKSVMAKQQIENVQPELDKTVDKKAIEEPIKQQEPQTGAEALSNYNRAFVVTKPENLKKVESLKDNNDNNVINTSTNFKANPEITNTVDPTTPTHKAEAGVENLEAKIK